MAQAPDLSLPQVGGPDVSLAQFRGKPTVLTIAGKDAADQAADVAKELGNRFQETIHIISVVDVNGLPRMLRGMAGKALERKHGEAIKELVQAREKAGVPIPAEPSDMLVMLRDADGAAAQAFGATGVDKEVFAVLIDATGNVVTSARGAGAANEIAGAIA